MQSLKRLWSFLFEIWPLWVAAASFVVAKSLEWAFLFPEPGQIVNYWFMVHSRTLILLFALCILPLAIISSFIWVFARTAQNKYLTSHPFISFLGGMIGVGVFIYANGLMCIQTFALSNKDFGHFQSARLGQHVYYVDSIWREGVWQQYLAYFVLFECDESGNICQNIHENVYQPDAKTYAQMTTSLQADSSAHAITLQVNGETVYVHRVK